MNTFYDARYLAPTTPSPTKSNLLKITDLVDYSVNDLKEEYKNKNIKLYSNNKEYNIIIKSMRLVGSIYDPDIEFTGLDLNNNETIITIQPFFSDTISLV
jgi:hypothetical protein